MKNFSCLPGAAGFNFTNFFDSARFDGQRAIHCQDVPNNQNPLDQSTERKCFLFRYSIKPGKTMEVKKVSVSGCKKFSIYKNRIRPEKV